MKKFLMTCAVAALMSGSAVAQDAAVSTEPDPSPLPVIQQIIIEEAPATSAEAEAAKPAPDAAAAEAAAQEQATSNAPAVTPPGADATPAVAAPEAAPVVVETAPAPAPEATPETAPAPAEAAPATETAAEQVPAPAPVEAAPAETPAAPAETAVEETPDVQPEPTKVEEAPKQAAEETKPAEAAPAVEQAKEQAAPKGPHEESPEIKRLNEEQLAKFREKQAAGQTTDQLISTTETNITEGPAPTDMNQVNFEDFDLNQDGTLAQSEVGEKLYRLFDLDGNEVIDNKEMETVNVLTIIPMERETIEVTEYFDGREGKVAVSQEEFLKTSKLIAYDKQKDGLTPLDFLGKKFNQVDVKDDKVIDLEEWKRAYAAATKKPHQENFRYNG